MASMMSELLGGLFAMAVSFSLLLAAINTEILGLSELVPDTAALAISIAIGAAVFLLLHENALRSYKKD